MHSPFVSIIIPTYNYGRFVAEAVERALSQTYPHREIIVVDDGSTDDTSERLESFKKRIRYIYQENQGLSAARNAGIRAARGELFAYLDSDDLWHPRKLEIQVQYMTEHSEVGLLATKDSTEILGGWHSINAATAFAATQVSLEELLVRSRFGPCGVLVRKDCQEAAGYFDTSLRSAEDRDMWIRIALLTPIVLMETPLWFYRLHDSSMSRVAARMEENEFAVLSKAFTTIGSIRWRLGLRLKSFSYCSYSAAYMYREAGELRTALVRIVRSLLLWPFPYRRNEVRMSLRGQSSWP